ncbi:hypothetical protein [Methanosarcina mazei]|jgi:hypothetical protein|nr:hypothetical protein [Methanosarcina mazei]MDY0246831.1 hypothetical protein [Methanosarcina mazei]
MKKFAFRGSASSGADDMEYKYDLNEKALYIEENRIPAYSMEKNEIGNCTGCDSILMSLSYHTAEENILVVTKCASCGAFYANIYDSDWNWVDEAQISLLPIPIPISNPVVDSWEDLKAIPIKKLEAVFSKGEIEALFARARDNTPIRQYLYRARKKYGLFEEIFNLKLEF